jgi:hypothetical protein
MHHTNIVMVHDSNSEQHTLIKREALTEEYVFEKILESEAWHDGLEVYIRNV